MLLVLSHDGDETANYLCRRLTSADARYVRLNTDTCSSAVRMSYEHGRATLTSDGQTLAAAEVRHVWLRRPKAIVVNRVGDQAEQDHVANEWSEALEGFLAHIPVDRWMNHPVNNVVASHKIEQLTQALAHGLVVPRTLMTQSMDAFRLFWKETGERVIAKPLASGFLEREDGRHTSIYTSRVHLDQMDSRTLASCPTLFQEEVRKIFDVRVTVVDHVVVAVALYREAAEEPDVRRDSMRHVRYEPIAVPRSVEIALLQLVRSYGLRFAAVDFGVVSDGTWVFFEINPNGQWAWLDIVGATTLWEHFANAFSS